MFQLLIVDDDVLFIKGLEMDIDQEKFNIGHIFRAYNIRQAKDILNEQKIDIILCDIEMPQGNGLELLTWIRENNIHSECVFLTSHQKFSYAKQAIQLGSIDYLLKPVLKNDLEAVMLKAIDTISKTKEIELANHYKELWNRHHPLIIERFWVDLINQTISSDMETIKKVVSERNISLTEEIIFLPILIG
ncbi:MAG TPA: response regulator, partial [Metabacillus sp.]|nr:response regulator [Metabacillus sp.]